MLGSELEKRDDSEITVSSIDKKFKELADNLTPITFSSAELSALRNALQNSGCNLDLSPEMQHKLLNPQFRGMDQEREQAVVASLGQDRAQNLLNYCRALRPKGAKIISSKTGKPLEGTEGRGERQAAAHILALGVFGANNQDTEVILGRLNTSLWKGGRIVFKKNKEDLITLNEKFINGGWVEPKKINASVMPKNIYPIWMFLTGRENPD